MRKAFLWILVITVALFAADPPNFETWNQSLGGTDSSQYSSLRQINKNNVKQLEVAWTYDVGGTGNIVFGPVVWDDTIYVTKPGNLVALDPATGKEKWTYAGGTPSRGINIWESRDKKDRRIVFTSGGMLTQLDARTGQKITSFGDNGQVDIKVGMERNVSRVTANNPGRIYEDIYIVPLHPAGTSYEATPGDVHAYDILTGKLLWQFHSIPHPGEYGYDTWPKEAWLTQGGVHNWSELTIDTENGIVFLPFGTARYDFYGANRRGDNLYGNSLVALDAKTGKRLWHFQTVHHDLWDYDLPTAPKLLRIRRNGRNVDVVAQPTKQGFLFVFERKTGAPIWPIEERPVPQSDVPGEWTSPTQPFPTAPPPFARQSFTEKDVNPYLPPEEQEMIRQRLRQSRNEGLFTPPSIRGSIQMPGNNGGANWGSSAVDPTKGTMYIVSKELPMGLRLSEPAAGGGRGAGGGARGGAAGTQPQCPLGVYTPPPRGGAAAPGGAAGGRGAGGARGAAPAAGAEPARGAAPAAPPSDFVRYTSNYDFMLNTSCGLSMIGPPWSQLTAYDLNEGKVLWQVPNGGVTALLEKGEPPTGAQFPRGGVVVTAGGLVFVGTASDRKFRAYDQDTGKVIWEYNLPAGSEGVPAVYMAGGRQFIVVPAGGDGQSPPRTPRTPVGQGQYIAFALPR